MMLPPPSAHQGCVQGTNKPGGRVATGRQAGVKYEQQQQQQQQQ